MFDLSSLQFNSEYPGMTAIIFTVMWSMLLGVLLAFTYEKTSREVNHPDNFLQALILVTIVSATIIQSIGDSVARGLGMLGALSIIRFRTTVKDSRNIVFMFAAIAIGIACGVYSFTIAIIGTLGFSITAFLLRYSSFSTNRNFTAKMKVQLDKSLISLEDVEKEIAVHCKKYILNKQDVNLKKEIQTTNYYYELKLKSENVEKELIDRLQEMEGVRVMQFSMERNLSYNI
jgi:uncharacterized membrane protein YhiD involved in acid resistance